jgi:hypothetical protein
MNEPGVIIVNGIAPAVFVEKGRVAKEKIPEDQDADNQKGEAGY